MEYRTELTFDKAGTYNVEASLGGVMLACPRSCLVKVDG